MLFSSDILWNQHRIFWFIFYWKQFVRLPSFLWTWTSNVVIYLWICVVFFWHFWEVKHRIFCFFLGNNFSASKFPLVTYKWLELMYTIQSSNIIGPFSYRFFLRWMPNNWFISIHYLLCERTFHEYLRFIVWFGLFLKPNQMILLELTVSYFDFIWIWKANAAEMNTFCMFLLAVSEENCYECTANCELYFSSRGSVC